jgi:phosphate transport system substrate-binding protein
MREVYPLADGAAAFDVCYEGITFDGDPVVYRSRCANARPRGARVASPGGVVAITAHPLFPWDGQFNWPWIPRAFDEPLIDAFERAHAGVMIDLDDGWSSSPLRPGRSTNADLALATSPAQVRPGQHAIPIGLTAVAILYHVNGVDHLRLSARAVAGIFDGTITMWNDPVIARDNPEQLPSIAIVATRAGERRPISAALARYVARAAPGAWHPAPDVSWPEGVPFHSLDSSRVEAAKTTNGAITYLEWPLAHAFAVPVASIENHAGRWVMPTAATTTAAGADVSVDDQLDFDPVATDNPGAYPIVYASWAAVDDMPSDPAKGQWLRTYLEFLLGEGQNVLVEGDYGRLSAAVVERARKALGARSRRHSTPPSSVPSAAPTATRSAVAGSGEATITSQPAWTVPSAIANAASVASSPPVTPSTTTNPQARISSKIAAIGTVRTAMAAVMANAAVATMTSPSSTRAVVNASRRDRGPVTNPNVAVARPSTYGVDETGAWSLASSGALPAWNMGATSVANSTSPDAVSSGR